MADIELIIKIDEEKYNEYKRIGDSRDILFEAIRNGTRLPKGHGRLGDLDALREEVSSWGMNDYEPSDFIDEIDGADVIIEVDKENKNV